MPARPSERPSRAGSSVPCPLLPQPASPAATTSAHATAIVFPGIRGRILLGTAFAAGAARAGRVHARARSEARGLERLVPSHARASERALGRLLEHEPEPLEGHLRPTPDPSSCADLPETVDQRGGLAVGRQLDVGQASGLLLELVHGDRAVASAATYPRL